MTSRPDDTGAAEQDAGRGVPPDSVDPGTTDRGRPSALRALRSLAVVACLVLFVAGIMLADVGVWAIRSVLDSEAFVRVATAALDTGPVRAFLADVIAREVAAELVQPDGSVPPPVLDALQLPAGSGVTAVAEAIGPIVDAELADRDLVVVRDDAIRAVHVAVTDTLLGRGLVPISGGAITLDLDRLVAAVDDRIDPGSPGLLFGQPLPSGLGSIALVKVSALEAVSWIARTADLMRWLLPAIAVLLGLATVLLARGRRRAVAWVGVVTVAVGGVAIAAAVLLSGVLGDLVATEAVASAAIRATLDAFLRELVVQSGLVVAIGFVLIVLGTWRRRPVARQPVGARSPS